MLDVKLNLISLKLLLVKDLNSLINNSSIFPIRRIT